MKKIARRNFLKLVGVSASIPILQSLPIASASATDLSDYPLLKDGIFDFENTDITQYVDDVQEVFGSEKDMIEEMLSSGELTPQDLKQHLLELAEQPSSVLVERGFSELKSTMASKTHLIICMRQMKEPVLQDPVQQSSSFMVLQEVVVGRR